MVSKADEIFDFILNNPDCTVRDAIEGLNGKRSTVTARISEMIHSGRIIITGKKSKNGVTMRKYRANPIQVKVPEGTTYLKMDKELLNILNSVESWTDERLTSFLTQDENQPHISRFNGDGYVLELYQYKGYPKIRLLLDYHSKGIKIDMIDRVRSFPSHGTYIVSNQHSSMEVRAK